LIVTNLTQKKKKKKKKNPDKGAKQMELVFIYLFIFEGVSIKTIKLLYTEIGKTRSSTERGET
jgi:hypothetical protein